MSKELDNAMDEFVGKHHIFKVLKYMLEVISIQNRENKKLGEYANHLHDVLEEIKGDLDPLTSRSLEVELKKYFFKLEAKELNTLRESRHIFGDFMKISRKLPRD